MTCDGFPLTYSTEVLMSDMCWFCNLYHLGSGFADHGLKITYIVIDALGRRISSLENVVIITMVDQEESTRLHAPLEVRNGQLLITLIPIGVRHVSKRIPQTDHSVKSISNQIAQILRYRQPVSFLNHCKIK